MKIISKRLRTGAGRITKNATLNFIPKLQARLLSNLYNNLFDVVEADTPALKEQAYRLRYQVFCLENEGYEDPSKHPTGMERDAYDIRSEQVLLIYKPTATAIGTLRIIKPDIYGPLKSFPMQHICEDGYLKDVRNINNMCEVSRLSISKPLREKVRQHLLKHKDEYLSLPFHQKGLVNLVMAIAPFGLYQGAFNMALDRGYANMLGTMEPFHMERLKRKAGLVVHKLGGEIEFHGIRQPFVMNIHETCENMQRQTPLSWMIISDAGRLHHKAECLETLEGMASLYTDNIQQEARYV